MRIGWFEYHKFDDGEDGIKVRINPLASLLGKAMYVKREDFDNVKSWKETEKDVN